jgi:hypothetical protein
MKEIQHQIKTVKLRQTDNSQHVTYPNVSHAPKTKEKRDHINNTADQSHKMIATRDPTHQYTMWMQLMSQVTPDNTKDSPHSRNKKKSIR